MASKENFIEKPSNTFGKIADNEVFSKGDFL